MRNFSLPLIAIAIICTLATSCNKKDDEEVEAVQYSNTAISSFALAQDDAVLPYLNTVFFSIDLVKGEVFNADSLPAGTDISSLAVTVGTGVLSQAYFTYTDANGSETVANYLADTKVKVNFANGPVKLTVASYDGTASRNYTVKVNVHKVNADILTWDAAEAAPLPTTLPGTIESSKTVDFLGKPAVFTRNSSGDCLAICEDVDRDVWTYSTPSLPGGSDLATLTSTGSTLYILSGSTLHSSTDGLTWTATTAQMSWIYGNLDQTLLGNLQKEDGSWVSVTYPGGEGPALPADCPVRATSQSVTYSSEWMASPVTMVAGGIKADGSPTGAAWSYDGSAWACTSIASLPAMHGVTLIPYFVFRQASNSWKTTCLTAFFAMGGTLADGTLNRTVYTSTDFGAHWNVASTPLQLPEALPTFTGAQALVYDTTMYPDARSSSRWIPLPLPVLPAWMEAATLPVSRAVTPIEEWECPFIYLYGGYAADGSARDEVWRGVINRLLFKPIQ